MKELTSTTKLIAVLAITVALVVIGILNLKDRLSVPAVATDGIEWVDTPDGVQAKSVSPDSPLIYAVKKGDYIRAFFYVGRYDSAYVKPGPGYHISGVAPPYIKERPDVGRYDSAYVKPGPGYLDYEDVDRAETISHYLQNQGVGN